MSESLVMSYKSLQPKIDKSAFLAPTATVIGDVTLGEGSSVWFNTILRGDIESIHVGKYTNIQDNSTVHVMGDQPTIIGDYVTIGHNSVIHCKKIGNNCLIGMGAVLLGYCEIGDNTIIGAGTVVTQHKKIPPNSLVLGSPGRIVRPLLDDEIEALHQSAIRYNLVAQEYMKK
jgi:carbonic anhydrase/acetyltransferase-like protein (isoleucine patch superfamily)